MDKTPARAALYLPHLESGGAERVMAQLAVAFAHAGHQVDMVLVQARGVYLQHLGPDVRRVDLGARNAYASFPGLVQYLRRERPQALLSTLDLTNLVAILARSTARVQTRLVVRTANTVSKQLRSPGKKKLERWLLASLYPSADAIIAPSKAAAADLAQYTRIPIHRIRAIYNPVLTPELFSKARAPLDHPWFTPGQPPVILGAGRLTAQKDFSTLLEAFARVRRVQPSRLVILGEGDQRSYLESLAVRLGIAADVLLPGFIENPFPYMRQASVFVLSSRWEGLPSVLIQALACGCPAVSTDCPSGPAEILDGGRWGHLTPVGEPRAMAKAILKVLSGQARRPAPGWLQQFEAAHVTRQYLDVLGLPYDQAPGAQEMRTDLLKA